MWATFDIDNFPGVGYSHEIVPNIPPMRCPNGGMCVCRPSKYVISQIRKGSPCPCQTIVGISRIFRIVRTAKTLFARADAPQTCYVRNNRIVPPAVFHTFTPSLLQSSPRNTWGKPTSHTVLVRSAYLLQRSADLTCNQHQSACHKPTGISPLVESRKGPAGLDCLTATIASGDLP